MMAKFDVRVACTLAFVWVLTIMFGLFVAIPFGFYVAKMVAKNPNEISSEHKRDGVLYFNNGERVSFLQPVVTFGTTVFFLFVGGGVSYWLLMPQINSSRSSTRQSQSNTGMATTTGDAAQFESETAGEQPPPK
jgi:fucose permease